MPVQTQLQQRRGTAASWTSTNPTLAAGEIGFESDTGKFKIGNGSTAWASLGYATNGAAVSPLTTKGDLYTYSTADARLAVGNNGETLVADSSTATGLRYQGNFAAGKNKIINGDFGIWQRGTSFANQPLFAYNADRFYSVTNHSAGTVTNSRQTFTGTDLPVAGAQYYLRNAGTSPTGGSFNVIGQKIENVQTFAGQAITVSFYAKADSARSVSVQLQQNFGSGGSAEVQTSGSSFSLTTSWARYSQTINVPSISGKTIGTSSFLSVEIVQPVNVSHTIDYYGVQAEAGSVVTAFQTATGTLQGELAACQRYYQRFSQTVNTGNFFQDSGAKSTTKVGFAFPSYVQFRAIPGSLETANVGVYQYSNATSYTSGTWTYLGYGPNNQTLIDYTHGSAVFTANNVCALVTTSAGSLGYIGLSAEL